MDNLFDPGVAPMMVLLSSDNQVRGSADLEGRVEDLLESELVRFSERITRVEVHLSDSNGPKGGANDKRCSLEARLAGLRPLAVNHTASTMLEAIQGASAKLGRLLENTVGKHDAHAR